MTTTIDTVHLASQLALSAAWQHLDEDVSPVDAACEVLEITPDDGRRAEVAGAVAAAGEMDWTAQVAMAVHLLLFAADSPMPFAA